MCEVFNKSFPSRQGHATQSGYYKRDTGDKLKIRVQRGTSRRVGCFTVEGSSLRWIYTVRFFVDRIVIASQKKYNCLREAIIRVDIIKEKYYSIIYLSIK